jgi:hypothetical protein
MVCLGWCLSPFPDFLFFAAHYKVPFRNIHTTFSAFPHFLPRRISGQKWGIRRFELS